MKSWKLVTMLLAMTNKWSELWSAILLARDYFQAAGWRRGQKSLWIEQTESGVASVSKIVSLPTWEVRSGQQNSGDLQGVSLEPGLSVCVSEVCNDGKGKPEHQKAEDLPEPTHMSQPQRRDLIMHTAQGRNLREKLTFSGTKRTLDSKGSLKRD